MPHPPPATVVIPTRHRASYLNVALGSIAPQALAAGAEVVVVSDGPDPPTEAVVRRHHHVRLAELAPGSGLNAGRNAGATAGRGELIVFVDDDVEALGGWLAALLRAAAEDPEYEALGGPIVPHLERSLRACGREPAPITSLDYGDTDRDVPLVWGANMVIRASALSRIGAFDESLHGRGDEEEWLLRLRAAGGRIRYVADAKLLHRRDRDDSRLSRMVPAAYRLGQTARRFDRHKGTAPPLRWELRTLAGSTWHAARRQCAYGVVFAAHAAGRLRELSREGRQ